MSDQAQWDKGYNDAIAYCEANYRPFQPMTLPLQFVHRGDDWSRGFGEGLLTGQNRIIDREYPENVGFSINDGKATIFYPKGHSKLSSK